MELDKKKIAAMSAVLYYIQSEEEQVCLQAASQAALPAQALAAPPVAGPKMRPWGLAGRQHQMQMRSLMQLKAFHR